MPPVVPVSLAGGTDRRQSRTGAGVKFVSRSGASATTTEMEHGGTEHNTSNYLLANLVAFTVEGGFFLVETPGNAAL
jgi:hypothetical protein